MVPRRAQPLRLLLVTPSYAPLIGGAERMLQAVSERLVSRGHRVGVLTVNGTNQHEIASPGPGTLPGVETINGVRVRRVSPDNAVRRGVRWVTGLRGGWRGMQAVFGEGIGMMGRRPSPLGVLPALLTSSQDVIVSANWIWPTAYGVHLARRLRRFRLVGFPIFHIARPWVEQLLYHEMLAACDAVLTLTDAEQQFVQARCRGRVEVTGAGVDPAPFVRRDGGAVRRLHNLGDGPVVGFIGRQDPLKGVLTLLEAMRLVWQARPEVRLLLGGPRAHRSREVSAALESLPAEHRPQLVDLSDFADRDGPSIIDACDVVALPSVEESFGLVFLEAWMCHKPVVGVRIPSTECVIEDGQDGLLARPMDPADLARCLLELLGDPGRAGMLGERGYRKTLARFTWDAVVDRWEAVLRDVVEGGRRGSKGVEEG